MRERILTRFDNWLAPKLMWIVYWLHRIFDKIEWWMEFLLYTCKFCQHPTNQHRGSMGPISTGQHFHGMCVNGFRRYGYEIYRHCGCWDNVPNWKFWVRKKR